MGVVRIDDKLLEQIKDWIKKNGNQYRYPTISTFVNEAIYNKLQGLNGSENTDD